MEAGRLRGTPIRRTGVLALALLPPAVVVAAWFVLRRNDLSGGTEHVVGAVADLAALLGLTGFVVLVTLGTRLAWVERIFGSTECSVSTCGWRPGWCGCSPFMAS